MALRAGQCNQLRSSISRLISVYQQEQHTALSRNSFSLPDLLPSEFCRAFAASPALHSLAEQQFSVLSPTSIAGPITRTPVYAIFELGSKQYKVSAGDVVWVERLKLVDVGTQLALNRVQVLGSLTETLVGRPYVETASVTAVVEVSQMIGYVTATELTILGSQIMTPTLTQESCNTRSKVSRILGALSDLSRSSGSAVMLSDSHWHAGASPGCQGHCFQEAAAKALQTNKGASPGPTASLKLPTAF